MKLKVFTNTLANLYRESIKHAEKENASFMGLGTNNLTKAHNDLMESLQNEYLPESVKSELKNAIEIISIQIEVCKDLESKNTYSRTDRDKKVHDMQGVYSRLMHVYTATGGKGIYDMHNVIVFNENSDYHKNQYLKLLEKMKDKGMDIEVIYSDPDSKDQYLSRVVSVVFPSSLFNKYQKELESEIPHLVETSFTQRSIVADVHHKFHLLTPNLSDESGLDFHFNLDDCREMIMNKLKKDSSSIHNTINNALSADTILTVSLPYSGFNSDNWQHDKEAIRMALAVAPKYKNDKFHFNGVSPSNYRYTDDFLSNKLNEEIPYSVNPRVNIVSELKYYDIRHGKSLKAEQSLDL